MKRFFILLNHNLKGFLIIALLCPALILICSVSMANADWQAGVASRIITPQEPLCMAGYGGKEEPSQGKIHDLYAKALALRDVDGTLMVLVTADLSGYTYNFTKAVSKEIENRLGIPRKSILFNASHTHCGPMVWDATEVYDIPDWLYEIPEPHIERIKEYTEWLKQLHIDVISDAVESLEPASVSFSKAKPVPFAVSRRFPTPNGIAYRSSPSSYYTGGARDDEVPVLKVSTSDGSVRAIVFGYACHPITLNIDRFCGDYPGFAQRYIEEKYPGATALFVQGCGGQLVPNARYQLEYARGHGRALAKAVEKALDGQQSEITGSLSCAYEVVDLGFKHIPTRKELDVQRASNNDLTRRKASFYMGKLDNGESIPASLPCPLQAIRLGNELLMIGIAGEPVVEYAAALKTELTSRDVWVAGYCNYVFGYLPTWKILKEGGYEGYEAMRYTQYPGAFDDTVEESVLNEIRRLVKTVSE